MMDVPAGMQIGVATCPGCGAELPLKKNVAGGVYFYCARILARDPATGRVEKCLTRMNIGRTGSRRMIAEFLANKKDVTEHAEFENREPEAPAEQPGIGHNGGPPLDDTGADGNAGAAPSGLIGALKHFLTE